MPWWWDVPYYLATDAGDLYCQHSPASLSIPSHHLTHTFMPASSAGDTSWKGRTGNRWWYDRARCGDDTSVRPHTWHAVGSSSTRAYSFTADESHICNRRAGIACACLFR